MIDMILKIAGCTVAFSIIYAIFWPRTVFLIKIGNREARLSRGKVSPKLIGDLSDIVAGGEPFQGKIRGVRQVGKFSIRFSRGFPDHLRQRFRNLWSIHMKAAR